MMGLGKLQLHAKFEVGGFICYGNIKESVFKRQIRFLSYPLGKLGSTDVIYIVEKRVVDFLFATIALFC